MTIVYLAVAVLVFLFTVLSLRVLIPKLRSMKMGQKILDIGPRWHKSKEGTPTMGGLGFVIPTTLVLTATMIYIKTSGESSSILSLALTLLLAIGNCVIGIVDDLTKFKKQQNEGLTAPQKFALQLAMAGAFIALLKLYGKIDTTLAIPFTTLEIELGWFYYIFALVFITGIINSVNLTDGIDGLASSVTLVVGAFFGVLAFTSEGVELAALSAAMVGATLGFLMYNFYPARVFMGDTGSLFLGGLVAGAAFMINNPLIVAIAGIIYICEAMSDIIQVGFYKLTHKRVFKMAPIHHHFEKCGWSEIKVVAVFSAVTALFCVIAYFAK
ncbi:MAG: phospho-N-acetylmuramoyl-pentapeptide-transferase [Ruminococcaceae bacterium]|nr:phospho-N-acetylmuramoyl-pentapeptide-transferase [Oscillospiraceae bacterium]